MKALNLSALAAATLLLAACGGGGGDDQPVVIVEQVPPSATASVAAWVAYVGARPLRDDTEPLDVAAVVPPTTETEEPSPVN